MRDMRDEESDDKVNEVASLLNPAKCISHLRRQKRKKERKKEEQNDNRSETRNEKIRMRTE